MTFSNEIILFFDRNRPQTVNALSENEQSRNLLLKKTLAPLQPNDNPGVDLKNDRINVFQLDNFPL